MSFSPFFMQESSKLFFTKNQKYYKKFTLFLSALFIYLGSVCLPSSASAIQAQGFPNTKPTLKNLVAFSFYQINKDY